jgi:hypothetical protein
VRRVSFTPPVAEPAWRTWYDEADRQRAQLYGLYQAFCGANAGAKFKPLFDTKTYKGSRPFLLTAFHDKCAYCESKISPTNLRGDAEHYRPKGNVKQYSFKSRATNAELEQYIVGHFDDAPPPQGGYFWLAYSIENLLPSCTVCNRYRKRDVFPVKGTRLVFPEADSPNEKRMLVNPVLDEPNEHLAFDDAQGMVTPLSREGAISIDVYDLNREGLPEARRLAMDHARRVFSDWFEAMGSGRIADAAKEEQQLDEYVAGTQPYSAAGLAAIGKREEEISALVQVKKVRGFWPSRKVLKLP